MTQDEIIAMAEEAGVWLPMGSEKSEAVKSLVRFSALAAAKEREACAQVCDATYYQFIGPELGEVRHGIAACAAAIRARSTT